MGEQFDFKYWNNVKMNLKYQFPQLSESDFYYRNGIEMKEMLRQIADKLGISRSEINEIVRNFKND